ncbi:MAG TPA: pyruvate kinase [Rhodospirillales bacterium]|nr:pyruvate kinase [Rhodospirillales bacterium]
MRRNRRTKIVATLGPSSDTAEAVDLLVARGADVFRLNFSHGTHDTHANLLRLIRAAEARHGTPLGVFADLQGPKLRLGTFASGPVKVEAGAPFRLDLDPAPGDGRRASLPHPEIFAVCRRGTTLLLDDGKVRLEVVSTGRDYAETRVLTGGVLSDHKGVNLPDVMLAISPLTAKDRADLEFALGLGITTVALSFVQRPEDLDEARELVAGRANIIAKIEKPSAIEHLYAIVQRADAVMVARGDLGVEMPPEDVPSLQKRIIRACRYAGRPVIVATQMLESMMIAPAPTRAEASDVATAVYEGVDAVMLSGESAAGRYPVEAVSIMDRIIRRTERDWPYQRIVDADRAVPETTSADAITRAARQVAETISAHAIVTFTASGSTSLRAARERPPVPILALTPNEVVARNLALAWGVHPIKVDHFADLDRMLDQATQVAVDQGYAGAGDRLVVTAGLPLETPGTTNALHIVKVAEGA